MRTDVPVSTRSPASAELTPGTILSGRYAIEAPLVAPAAAWRSYAARQLSLEATVAVHVVSIPRGAAGSPASDAARVGRFHDELRALGRLRHPNLSAVLDLGQVPGGSPYLVTELPSGRTLEGVVREEGALTPRRIVDLLGQALSAIAAAHAAGVLHLGLSAASLRIAPLVGGGEHVTVGGFGAARLREGADEGAEPCDDVRAVGAILYALLTGCPAWTAAPRYPVEPPRLRALVGRARAGFPVPAAPLEAVCLRAIAERREDRFPTASELARALQAALREGERWCRRCDSELSVSARFCAACGCDADADEWSDRTGVGAAPTLPPTPAVAAETEPTTDRRRIEALRAATAVACATGQPLPFVGREAELEALNAHAAGTLVLLGVPGSGRTRLLDEWRGQIGGRVIVMRPDASGALESWRPVRAALSGLLGLSERPSSEEVDQAVRRQTDRLGVRELFCVAGPGDSSEDELRRRETVAAAVATFRGYEPAAGWDGGTPLTVICEDVDRYDRRSLEVVTALAADPGALRVVVSATRSAEFGPARTLTLGPLSPAALDGLGIDPADAERTDGIPLTVEQFLRARASGAVEGSLRGHLAVLSPEERQVLAATAVAGDHAEMLQLVDVLPDEDIADPLTRLVRRGLVRLADGRAELGSPTQRDQIYHLLLRPERRAFHRAWLAVLERQGTHGAAASPIVLAHHDWQADPAAAKVETLERAAEAAERAHDGAGTVRWRTRALDRARSAGAPLDRARLGIALGDVLSRVGDLVHAEVAYQEALGLLDAAGGGGAGSVARGRRGLGRLHLARGGVDEAMAELSRARAVAAEAGEPVLLGELALDRSEALALAGRAAEATAALEEGIGAAGDRPEVSWRLRFAQAERLHIAGQDSAALAAGAAALEAASQVSAPAVARVRCLLAQVCQTAGEFVLAAGHRRAALEAVGRAGDRRAAAELMLATAEEDSSSSESAVRWARLAGELARQIGWRDGVSRANDLLHQLSLAA